MRHPSDLTLHSCLILGPIAITAHSCLYWVDADRKCDNKYRIQNKTESVQQFIQPISGIARELFSRTGAFHSHRYPPSLPPSRSMCARSTTESLAPVVRLDKLFPSVNFGRRRQDLLAGSDIFAAIVCGPHRVSEARGYGKREGLHPKSSKN